MCYDWFARVSQYWLCKNWSIAIDCNEYGSSGFKHQQQIWVRCTLYRRTGLHVRYMGQQFVKSNFNMITFHQICKFELLFWLHSIPTNNNVGWLDGPRHKRPDVRPTTMPSVSSKFVGQKNRRRWKDWMIWLGCSITFYELENYGSNKHGPYTSDTTFSPLLTSQSTKLQNCCGYNVVVEQHQGSSWTVTENVKVNPAAFRGTVIKSVKFVRISTNKNSNGSM